MKNVCIWGYTPNLYHWHVLWIHCEDCDTLEDFDGYTPEESIDKAYKWFHSKFSKIMITEDYVSFETAKLLKEKGYFNISDTLYKENGEFVRYKVGLNNKGFSATLGNFYEAPTLQMAMKWLREVHNLVIHPAIGNENDEGNADYYNPDRWYWFFDITNEKGVVIDTESDYILNEYSSREEACEAAIKYCLENLI